MIKLDILSDPICPWCYIGKTALDRALKDAPPLFVIEWHPFQLNPDMPQGGMDRRAYLETKFGGKERAVQVYARIAEAAEQAGLFINFAAIARTPNTLDAHRLIHWAGIEAAQGPVVDGLFAAYFEQGRDIGDRAVLAEIAGQAGLDPEIIARTFETDADRDDIIARDRHSRERGVTGVPTFVLGGRHVLPGAQPTEQWARIIADLTAQAEAGA